MEQADRTSGSAEDPIGTRRVSIEERELVIEILKLKRRVDSLEESRDAADKKLAERGNVLLVFVRKNFQRLVAAEALRRCVEQIRDFLEKGGPPGTG